MALSAAGAAAQQLAEVLAVLASSQGEDTAAQRGIERIAECFEAEAAALVRGGGVAAVIGFALGRVPEAELLEAAAGKRQNLELPGAGTGAVVTVPVERETGTSIVLVRSGDEGFDPEELSLLRGMAKVLALALRMQRTVDTLQQSEEHSRAILQFADDAFISMDASGCVTAWNEKAIKTFGWSESEAIGRELADLIVPPRYRQAHREGLARFLVTGEGAVLNQRIEIEGSRADGIEIPVELAIWPVSSKGVWTFNAFVRDISERRRAAEALERLATELRLLLESAAEGIWGVDIDGNFTFVNSAAAQMLGWAPEELIGKNSHLTVHHSRPDGTPYPIEDCPTYQSFRTGEGHRLDGEVLWRRDGTPFPTSYASFPLQRDGVLEGAVITCSDITDRQRAADALREANLRLQELASTDALTGLPNRALFSDRLDQALALARRVHNEVAVLFMDLDRFKHVNDSLGHHAGDELLLEVSRRLSAAVRDSDTVARFGGDEFAVLLGGSTSPEEAAAAAERILESFRAPFLIGGMEFFVSASVGVALWPEDCSSKVELLQHADVAMYRAKAAGGNSFEMFQPAMTVAARDRLTMENELRRALEENQLFLRYHPQVDLASGKVVGVEALVRWQHPTRGEVMPVDFIPVAEDSGLIVPMGAWVLAEACRQAVRWRTELAHRAPLRMGVNVSPRQLTDPGFAEQVTDLLLESGLPVRQLELEVTESTLITDASPALATLKVLRHRGISVAIDDFGSGYSSLGHLRRFPVDRLKLDMSFIAGLGRTGGEVGRQNHTALVAAAVDLAHALGISALAEGVETEEQRLALVAIGAEEAQGYLWTRPLRSADLPDWLSRHPLA
ncbi:MAG TPA: EAL domain-containing protein [Acidimicrobiales bacterium]|nr:EAL domain-containing protein [Acidimicrobiales bacterium]